MAEWEAIVMLANSPFNYAADFLASLSPEQLQLLTQIARN